MSTALAKQEQTQLPAVWSNEQRDLIKRTCMPQGSTDDELALFLHVAAKSGLDPMRRHIHCTKVGGRLAFIADINGLQARAAQETDYEGILHATVFEQDVFEVDEAKGEVVKHTHNPFGQNGKIVGAWAVVRRRGMLPFLSVVRFTEYDNGNNPLWRSKPGVMIDKVGKSTALRLAYPTVLGGVYEASEMDQATPNASGEAAPVLSGPDTVRAALNLGDTPPSPPRTVTIVDESTVPDAELKKQRSAKKEADKPHAEWSNAGLLKRKRVLADWLKANPGHTEKLKSELELSVVLGELARRSKPGEPPLALVLPGEVSP